MSTPFLSKKIHPEILHTKYMSIPRPDLRGGFLFFPLNIFGRTYINVSKKRVQNHKRVWELHTSAATPPSLLFSVASTANLVGHNMFTSFVDRYKNANF